MRKLILIGTVVLLTATSASAQSSGPMLGMWGNNVGGGGFGVRYPVCTRTPTQANGHSRAGCDSLCQTKCQGAWRALGFRSVNACVARWAKLNAEGTAATCETAIKANGMRPIRGC
jgi:hypothetical protein